MVPAVKAKLKSLVRRLLSRGAIGRPLVRLRFRMSRLSTRIMAIMLVPLVLFFIGLFSIDQYRTTLIRSEFTALELLMNFIHGSPLHALIELGVLAENGRAVPPIGQSLQRFLRLRYLLQGQLLIHYLHSSFVYRGAFL